MKRIMLFVSALAAMVLAGSCQQELNPVTDGDTTVTFSVAAGDVATKAIADGTNVDALYWEIYGTDVKTATAPLGTGSTSERVDGKFTVNLKLLADQEYNIIFWAQVNREEGKEHYTWTDLRHIELSNLTGIDANDESRAAFFKVYNFTTENGVSINETVTLKRPFSQINLGSTTYETSFNNVNDGNVKVETSQMTVTQVATSFNTLDGVGEGEQVITYNAAATPNGEADKTQKILEVNGLYYYWLGMNYLIVTGDSDNVDVDITLVTNFGNVEHTVENVPVKENYRTNLLGDFLTTGATFNVVVDADFETNDYVVEGETSFVSVSSAEELVKVFDEITDGESECSNIILGGDIDLADLVQTRSAVSNWTPIGTPENPFTGTFNGNGYTIKNLCIVEDEAKEGKAYIGFFGYAKDATIKNVTLENVYINIPCLDIDHSQGHIGAVAGSLEGTSTIENVTVKGDIQIYATQNANGASRVAVVAGGNSYGNVTMKNVHVKANEGSSLIANNNTGALAGQLQGKMYFENCSSNIDVTVNKFFAGGLVGIAAGDSEFVDCHTTGNVSVVAGREGRHNDEYRVGGIAGGWADGKNNVCTLVNCSYTGNVSGKNVDGSEAEPLDYMGYVGRGYTLSNCAGSKVVIDGVEFVQRYDNVYGVYTINGLTPVATADELVAALAAGEGVFFMNDITVAATKGGYNKAGILQNKAQTIDGNGHTLTVTGAGATWDCAIYTNGGIIKNLTVAGAMRGIFTAGTSADLYIDNVIFDKVIYTFNSDAGNKAYGVYVSNSTLNGWTSHSDVHKEVVYTNCSFGEGSGYKYCRPYGPTSFVNCTFCQGYTVDESQTTEITYTDCTWEE